MIITVYIIGYSISTIYISQNGDVLLGDLLPKLKTLIIKQELVDQVEKEIDKGKYGSLSEFVSDAIQLRLETLTAKRTLEHLEHPRIIGVREYTCQNKSIHNVKVVKYDDSSIWVTCPMFGWFEKGGVPSVTSLGCKERKQRCTWFVG